MEDLKEFYSDRMKKWETPPRLTLDKLLEKVDEDRKVDRINEETGKIEKVNLLKQIAVIMGLRIEEIFK